MIYPFFISNRHELNHDLISLKSSVSTIWKFDNSFRGQFNDAQNRRLATWASKTRLCEDCSNESSNYRSSNNKYSRNMWSMFLYKECTGTLQQQKLRLGLNKHFLKRLPCAGGRPCELLSVHVFSLSQAAP